MSIPNRIKRKDIHKVRNAIQETQSNKCVLCGGDFDSYTYHQKKRKVVIKYRPTLDHDHSSGAVRGVLCSYCNAVEGKINSAIKRYHPYLKDPLEKSHYLVQLGQYLQTHTERRITSIHPDYLTDEEKRLKANKKQRAAYKRRKQDESDAMGTTADQGETRSSPVSDKGGT